ncbi:site-specific integrase [Nocardia amamiensis]|uniref:Site-specific integrase n=1 Tax=Nocardia amamiensis TaxID=404578 RepID=A0ABS0D6D7_9NOCA|nr:site-specific integrase [Nocardia amamiensis]MBF6302683.1 site-specific integrase [Nocardia amamiensis]
MTAPVTTTEHTRGRSPFAGLDLCRTIGIAVAPGAVGPNFDQDVWDFNTATDLAAYLASSHKRWNLAAIRNPRWRVVAKEYLVALMVPTHEAVRELPGAFRVARTVSACIGRHYELIRWLNWLTDNGITELGQVDDHLCDSYIAERRVGRDKSGEIVNQRGAVNKAAQIVSGLAQYHDLFTTDRYLPGFRPFGGRAAVAVAGLSTPAENSTPPVPIEILQPMLAAALYLIDTLGPHIVPLIREVEADRERVNQLPHLRSPGRDVLLDSIEKRVSESRPFNRVPSRVETIKKYVVDESDPLWGISLRDVAAEAGCGHFRNEWLPILRPALEQAVAQVGIEEPIRRDAALVTRADGQGQVPWTRPLSERHARVLPDILRTACLLVIAATTGMRASELSELVKGCRLPPEHTAPGLTRYRVAGTIVKNRGHGGEPDEWVVLAEVHRAIALAEQLLDVDAEPGTLLFGRISFKNIYGTFRTWVNSPAGERLGLAPIPDIHIDLRMLRRTLAIELAYRPGGLLAAKLALKHISVVTTEGYAGRPGGAQAKFLAEVGAEEQKRNLGLLLDEIDNYQNGIRPSGPHARQLIEFFDTVDGNLTDEQRAAPKIILNDQELRRMLAKRANTLHLGTANYCWFTDPAKALCLRLAGTPTADRPLIGMCDSARCPQATHHPRHRPIWQQTVQNTTVFLGNLGRAQKTERTRLEAQRARALRVLADIDAADAPTPAAIAAEER